MIELNDAIRTQCRALNANGAKRILFALEARSGNDRVAVEACHVLSVPREFEAEVRAHGNFIETHPLGDRVRLFERQIGWWSEGGIRVVLDTIGLLTPTVYADGPYHFRLWPRGTGAA